METEKGRLQKPTVAIVGRPNVGKSTLFNRLVGHRISIVSDLAGTTRDRIIAETNWSDHSFILVDTGGLELFPDDDIWNQVKSQIHYAINECDVVIFLVDISDGITSNDQNIVDTIRKTGKPVVTVASKADNEIRDQMASELYSLGMGDPVPISAYHNRGLDDLMDRVVAHFPENKSFPEPEADLGLAIVGRTNVGKSMLINSLSGENRAIVSDIAGTTRDSLDSVIKHKDMDIQLVDTAGIRRRGQIDYGIESYSVLRSIQAIDRCDVAALVIDASEFATAQDTHVANYILEAHKGIVILVNKWDLSNQLDTNQQDMANQVRAKFKFIQYAPICFTSGLTGAGIGNMLDIVTKIQSERSKIIPRAKVRRTILTAVANHPPPIQGKRELKIYSAMQDGTSPPSFTFFVNHPDMIHFSYKRYMENSLREDFGFEGSPLRMRFRGRGRNTET
ncbi:MAG: ribosome biogenesis GTPase Der [Chloroflexi bacterium]|nr:ribosome biogenesis GTPase Der [Chloroflexota bacterium]